MKAITIFFATVGLFLICWASTLPPYKNSVAVSDAMTNGPTDLKESRAASEKYWAARDSQLTWKFGLQDYGGTALAVAALVGGLLLFTRVQGVSKLLGVKTPGKPWTLIVVGAIAVVLTLFAHIVSLFLGAARNEYPPWADSIGIPLMGTPVILLILLSVAGFFYRLGSKRYSGGMPVLRVFSKKGMPHLAWALVFGIPLFVTTATLALSIIAGDFLFTVPSAIWTLFFALLFAGKQRTERPADEWMQPTSFR